MKALAILDLQHIGKPGKKDLGASHDFDGDGLISQGENEADMTPIYAAAAKAALEAAGVEVLVVDSGAYKTRWKNAAKAAKAFGGPVAYVACHLNKGAGDYGLVCFDYRSAGGRRMAREVAAELALAFSSSELRRVISDDRAATGNPDSGFPRAFYTLSGIYAGPSNLSGVCFEPLFLDTHSRLLGGLSEREARERCPRTDREAAARKARTLDRVGRSLAAGLLRWLHLHQ